MIYTEFIVAIALAVIFTVILLPLLGWPRPGRDGGGAALLLVLLLMLGTWAAMLWVTPLGPAVMGVYWVPGLATAWLLALLILAIAPRRGRAATPAEATREAQAEARAERLIFGVFFWLLVLSLVAAVVTRYAIVFGNGEV